MKVIDLFNQGANGEEMPEKIKYNGEIYYLDDGNYSTCNKYGYLERLFQWEWSLFEHLNDEVEIIEEDKKIEKIETYDKDGNIFIDDQCFKYVPIDKHCLTANEQVFVDKINEIIDFLEEDE